MRVIIPDTNILVANLTGDEVYDQIHNELNLDSSDIMVLIPFAVKAEILSIARKRAWGPNKMSRLRSLLNEAIIVDVDNEIIDSYVEIDAFSQGKHPDIPLNNTARNMGKNDLWIAAICKVVNGELITLDKDFNHLNDAMIKVHYFPRKKGKKTT